MGEDEQRTIIHLVVSERFLMNILRNLVLRLNYKEDQDSGS